MRWLPCLVVAACTPSQAQLDRENTTAEKAAMAAAASAGEKLSPPTVDVPASADVAAGGSHGLEDGEHLARAADGQLVFRGAMCLEQEHCGPGCSRSASYEFHRTADGRIVIVRLHPRFRSVATTHDSSCAATCGGNPPGEPVMASELQGLGLGVTSLDQIEVRDDAYTVKYINRVCTNMTPVP